MTDIIETHGPSGATIQTVGKRPWKAPRLIDLDDNDANSCAMGVLGTRKNQAPNESSSVPNCYFTGDPAIMVAS